MSKIFAEVSVPPMLYYFYKKSDGDIYLNFDYKQHDPLSKLINSQLSTPPDDYVIGKLPYCLRINLQYSRDKNINTKNYLDENAQRTVAVFLHNIFKDVFHNYIIGFMSAGGLQRDAIFDFCCVYNIPIEHINYESLKKSWDRSTQKQMLKNIGRFIDS